MATPRSFTKAAITLSTLFHNILFIQQTNSRPKMK